jgi:hypothetical protein
MREPITDANLHAWGRMRNEPMFLDRYRMVHPNSDPEGPLTDTEYVLEGVHSDIVSGWKYLLKLGIEYDHQGPLCKEALVTKGIYKNGFRKGIWILWENDIKNVGKYEDINERIIDILTSKNDESINLHDYILYLYISYQNTEMQNTLNALPVTALRDILNPIIDNNITTWEKKMKIYEEDE